MTCSSSIRSVESTLVIFEFRLTDVVCILVRLGDLTDAGSSNVLEAAPDQVRGEIEWRVESKLCVTQRWSRQCQPSIRIVSSCHVILECSSTRTYVLFCEARVAKADCLLAFVWGHPHSRTGGFSRQNCNLYRAPDTWRWRNPCAAVERGKENHPTFSDAQSIPSVHLLID